MASVVILLLVAVQFYCNSVLGSVLETSTVCGGDQVEYLKAPDGFFFSLNGRRIEDPVLICEVLELHFRSGCLVCDSGVQQWRRIGEKYCNPSFAAFGRCGPSDISLNIIKQVGRKLLLELPKDVSDLVQESERDPLEEESQEYKAFPESENINFVVPSMFLLCCGILCPCFYAKRREPDDHNALSRQVNSLDLATSFDTSQMSVSEKFPATPRVPPSPSRFSLSPQLSTVGPVNLTFNQIIKATQSFSPSLKLGEGGFGTVYKAVLPDGQVVAIKRAKKEQVSQLRDEFSNEVELLSKIEHRNLVRLLGYTDKGSERIIITEYVPNGTLREHLDGQRGRILDFNQRLEIAIDVAHALTYLHQFAEKTIIHRDVKSSNILLTEAYRAKVSDFGFARSGPTDVEQTHISTKVKGTAGYLDPEYLRTYQLTPKSDVFSFGILLIEIVSGRRPVDLKRSNEEKITVRWAFKKHNEGNVREVVDPLLDDYVQDEIVRMMLDLAFQCAAPTRADRPSMEEAGKQLWEIRREYSKTRKGT